MLQKDPKDLICGLLPKAARWPGLSTVEESTGCATGAVAAASVRQRHKMDIARFDLQCLGYYEAPPGRRYSDAGVFGDEHEIHVVVNGHHGFPFPRASQRPATTCQAARRRHRRYPCQETGAASVGDTSLRGT
jgi:hypothetical protein